MSLENTEYIVLKVTDIEHNSVEWKSTWNL